VGKKALRYGILRSIGYVHKRSVELLLLSEVGISDSSLRLFIRIRYKQTRWVLLLYEKKELLNTSKFLKTVGGSII